MDGAGLMRLSIADASLGSSTGSVYAFWERLQLRFTFGFKAEAPAAPRFVLEPRGSRRGLPNWSRTCAAVVPRRSVTAAAAAPAP